MRQETVRSRVCGKHTSEPWEPCPFCKDMTQAQKDDMLSLARDTFADEMFELVGNAPHEQWARINDALEHMIDAHPEDVHRLTCHCGGCSGTAECNIEPGCGCASCAMTHGLVGADGVHWTGCRCEACRRK